MEERKMLAKIAEMYYRNNLTQKEIAEKMDISRSMISRFLARAIELGVVEVIIHYSDNRARDLEKRLRDTFGLRDARVATTNTSQAQATEDGLRYSGVHALADDYLHEIITEDTIMAVSWGKALSCLHKALRPKRKIPSLRVVQAFGSAMPNQEQDGAALVGGFASLFGGSAYFLHAPLHVSSAELRDSLVSDHGIMSVIQLAERANFIITGIGDTAPVPSGVAWMYYLTEEEDQSLQRQGKVGHVCTRHFDINGNFLDSPAYKGIIGLSHDSYMHIDLRVGVSYGSRKIEPILGAVRGGYVNVLITDEETAEELLARAQAEARKGSGAATAHAQKGE